MPYSRDFIREFITMVNRSKRRVGRTKPYLSQRVAARRPAAKRAKQARKINRK